MTQTKSIRSNNGPAPAPGIENLKAYKPQRFPEFVDLRLDGNEGSIPPVRFFDLLDSLGSDVMRRYPDSCELEASISEILGISTDRVLVTAGGDDALDRICRSYLFKGTQVILPEPTFEMIGRYARLAGAEVTTVPWMSGPYPIGRVKEQINPATKMIVVVSPNSPTGSTATIQDLETLSLAAPQALLLVDQAYSEFADFDLTPAAMNLPNAVVVRTLSKAWGLAGLRVGYAVGPKSTIDCLRAVGQPYAVSAPSLALAKLRITQSRPEVEAFVDRVRSERQELITLLPQLGAQALPSQANFVLARFDKAGFIQDALAALGIAVRRFPNQPVLEGFLRITCPGNPIAFNRLKAAFRSILAPEALLFDLDGVLADVSKSYRKAVLATAASFGVELCEDQILMAKNEPGSNNDWVLTQRLLERRGVGVSLDTVTRRFERIYQGDEHQPGLRFNEKLCVDHPFLARLSKRFPLAVVTGRPRKDALRFLEQTNIAAYLQTLICMEDAAAKPDPAPVRLAMSKLGVKHAWMVGDMPDDIRAARAAGVLPLGVLAPGDCPDRMQKAMLDVKAACFLENLYKLEELLP